MPTPRLALEAVIVGAVLAVVLASVTVAMPGAFASPGASALTGLVLGALVHLGFEAAGLNAAYCSVGHACQ